MISNLLKSDGEKTKIKKLYSCGKESLVAEISNWKEERSYWDILDITDSGFDSDVLSYLIEMCGAKIKAIFIQDCLLKQSDLIRFKEFQKLVDLSLPDFKLNELREIYNWVRENSIRLLGISHIPYYSSSEEIEEIKEDEEEVELIFEPESSIRKELLEGKTFKIEIEIIDWYNDSSAPIVDTSNKYFIDVTKALEILNSEDSSSTQSSGSSSETPKSESPKLNLSENANISTDVLKEECQLISNSLNN